MNPGDNWSTSSKGQALQAEIRAHLEVSNRRARDLIDRGAVEVNGTIIDNYGHRLDIGDAIKVDVNTRNLRVAKRHREAGLFKLLLEDRHIVAVDKPAGLLTIPTSFGETLPTLVDALTENYRQRGLKNPGVHVVHRLDRYTSGVLLFARSYKAAEGLRPQFEDHTIDRRYLLITDTSPDEDEGTFRHQLFEEKKSLRIYVARGGQKSKAAITHWRVIDRIGRRALIEARLETGRRNQIRVQFAHEGYPLLGDHKYGKPSKIIKRQALHARRLAFAHPVDGKPIVVESPPPEDFSRALTRLGHN